MVAFFIPHLKDNPAAAEAEWQRYLRESLAPASSRRVYSVTYEHEDDKYEVTVGRCRKCYPRKTGPRGGYIKNAEHRSWGSDTGTMVSGIVDAGDQLHVWSYGPPFGGWGNPSSIGQVEVRSIERFDEPVAAEPT